jgi:hypothetical protein
LRQIKILLSAWYLTREPETEFIQNWHKVLSRFPAAIVEEAADAFSGIAAAHPKYPPSAGALRMWCEAREDHYRRLVAEPRSDAPSISAPRSEAEKAQVAAKAAWCIGSLAHALNRRTEEDLRAEAEAKLAIAAAQHGNRLEISDTLKRNIAERDGPSRRGSGIDDPDLITAG